MIGEPLFVASFGVFAEDLAVSLTKSADRQSLHVCDFLRNVECHWFSVFNETGGVRQEAGGKMHSLRPHTSGLSPVNTESPGLEETSSAPLTVLVEFHAMSCS
jgi:hypothetical protein